ncbi:BON domain-containing protein [Pararobbsia alpina]
MRFQIMMSNRRLPVKKHRFLVTIRRLLVDMHSDWRALRFACMSFVTLMAAGIAVAGMVKSAPARADEVRTNHGDDPFLSVSKGIASCPVPLGPMQTDKEWLANSHNRIEHGNNCWSEGRCRLMNAYYYDKDIADTVQRRLRYVDTLDLHWKERTTLWLMIQSRVIYVQGCVAPDFDKKKFLAVLRQTADVDEVVDNTTTHPDSPDVPYRTQANPDRLVPGDPN